MFASLIETFLGYGMDPMDENPFFGAKKDVKTNTAKHTNAWIASNSRCRLDPAFSNAGNDVGLSIYPNQDR